MADAPKVADTSKEIVRCLRVLEYIGPREWVERTINNPARYVNGYRQVSRGVITEHLTGIEASTTEVLEFEEARNGS